MRTNIFAGCSLTCEALTLCFAFKIFDFNNPCLIRETKSNILKAYCSLPLCLLKSCFFFKKHLPRKDLRHKASAFAPLLRRSLEHQAKEHVCAERMIVTLLFPEGKQSVTMLVLRTRSRASPLIVFLRKTMITQRVIILCFAQCASHKHASASRLIKGFAYAFKILAGF